MPLNYLKKYSRTKVLLTGCILSVIAFVTGCNQVDKQKTSTSLADAVYFGGDIITMEGDQPQYAEAVVAENGVIAFVGSKEEALLKYKNVNQIDLRGKTMLPAFLDGHGHFYNVGFAAMCANVLPPPDGPGADFNSIINALNEYKNTEEGIYVTNKLGWIVGNGYDDSQLAEKNHPKASDLDKVSTEVPVMIIHQSGHIGVINTKGLELIGYNSNTPNPEGGLIRKDSNGNPTGVLEEQAFFTVLIPMISSIDDEMAVRCIKKGQEEYTKYGYLTAQDGRTTTDQLSALKKAAADSLFYIDIVAYPDITLGTEGLNDEPYAPNHSYKNKFRVGGVKLTLDGSPQGKTAWLTKCYHVNPEGVKGSYFGYAVMVDKMATYYVKSAYKNKWQLICHANGDAAIDQYIKAIKDAQSEFGYDDNRTVLIHGQTLRKDQIPQLVEYNILPSLFPMHTFYWGDWHRESVLGSERAEYISPCRDVIDAGLTITSHHDAPVTFPNSMRVLDATVNRVTRSGKILGADQRISVFEALKSLTEWAAYQYFEESSKGTISVGKLADFVILNENPLKIDPLKIHSIKIMESIKEATN